MTSKMQHDEAEEITSIMIVLRQKPQDIYIHKIELSTPANFIQCG